MKKVNKKQTMITAAVIACIGAVAIGFPVRADQSKSQGNIVFQEGEMALYTSDIDYLMSELDSLFAEIPDEDKISSDVVDYARKNKLQSRGVIDYAGGTVIISSFDLINLANEIDILENTYKQIILKYLNDINTYMADDGSVVHDIVESDASYYPTFNDLINGISLSQEVYTETTVDSLSKDKGAWVNGEYVVGNGNDVNAAYLKGLEDGFNDAMENCTISYVYHEHTGEQSGAGSGCYQGYHVHVNSCYEQVQNGICGNNSKLNGYSCPIHGTKYVWVEDQPHGDGIDSYVCHAPNYTTNIICSSPYDHWRLICGKTESTIESATIVFVDDSAE